MSGPRPVSSQGSQSAASQGMRAGRGPFGLSAVSESPVPRLGVEVASDQVHALQLREFVGTLLGPDEHAPHAFAEALLEHGLTAEQLYEGMFAEAARVLGEMWASDDCNFYEVTVGTGRIHRLIREFSHQFLAHQQLPGHAGRILLAVASDEQHSLGIAILAEFFVRDGWDVHIGPGLGSENLLDKVRESEYDLLGFSIAVSSRISKLQQDIRRARQVSRKRDIKVLIGGQLITADPSLSSRIGADGYAVDARSAVSEARRLISA